jgi:hypothetical protein
VRCPTYLWLDAGPDRILEFLAGFNTHPSAIRVNTKLLREYIERQVERGELTKWTVVLFANGEGDDTAVGGLKVGMTKRSPNLRSRSKEEQKRDGVLLIRRLLSPRDPAVDLNASQYDAAVKETKANRQITGEGGTYPSTPAIAAQRDKGRGLLMLYAIDSELDDLDTECPLIGFALSFPQSDNAPRVSYSVNNVYRTLEVEGE